MTKSASTAASRAVPIGLAILVGLVALVGLWIVSSVTLLVFGAWGAVALALGVAAFVGAVVLIRRR